MYIMTVELHTGIQEPSLESLNNNNMVLQSADNGIKHTATKVMAASSSSESSKPSLSSSPTTTSTAAVPQKGQHNNYQAMYNTPERPAGFYQIMWSKIQTIFIYIWVFIQTLFLIAGLTVLHFSTFSVMMAYVVNGVVKRRREFLPQY